MRTTGCVIGLCALALAGGAAPPARAEGGASLRGYRLRDVGTLGGSLSLFYNFDQVSFATRPLNDRGQLAVTSLTTAGFAAGAEWSRAGLRPLAQLPNANVGGGGSNANGINAAGVVVGAADDGAINPRNGAPFDHAVWWDATGIHRLPELDGNASWASFVADDGLVVGYASNAVPDPYTYAGTQTRAVVWQGGVLHDLGTLGGASSMAFTASVGRGGRGRADEASGARTSRPPRVRVIGTSTLDAPAGPPFGVPPTAAFLWADGAMIDLGDLGGAYSVPSAINERGQITVISFDATNRHFQSFLWEDGRSVVLAAPGGAHFVEATALNETGRIVGGVSDASDATAVATVWSATGNAQLLGTVGADTGSIALGVSARGDVVGGSGRVSFTAAPAYAHAFVWDGHGPLVDLNTRVPAGASLTLTVAYAVNERGDIAGLGTDAAGQTHAFVLSPIGPDEAR